MQPCRLVAAGCTIRREVQGCITGLGGTTHLPGPLALQWPQCLSSHHDVLLLQQSCSHWLSVQRCSLLATFAGGTVLTQCGHRVVLHSFDAAGSMAHHDTRYNNTGSQQQDLKCSRIWCNGRPVQASCTAPRECLFMLRSAA